MRSQSRGQAMVEAALVLPIFVIVVLAVIQLGAIQNARIFTEYAVFAAARAGSVFNARVDHMKQAALVALLPTFANVENAAELRDALRSLPKRGPRLDLELQPSNSSGLVREVDFDRYDGGAVGAPVDEGTLQVRLRHWLELSIPVGNFIVYWAWRLSQSGDDGLEWTGRMVGEKRRDGRFFLPLEAHYSIRMQSNRHFEAPR